MKRNYKKALLGVSSVGITKDLKKIYRNRAKNKVKGV